MSKSSKQRRSDDEFKPPSAKKSKHVKQEQQQEHQSVQRIRLLDLIKCNYLNAGEEVFVKEQEGVITDRGTIKVLSSSGYIEYSNPTSWTKQVTGRENGGWGQIRLKASKQTLSSIKELYQKNMSTMEFMDDSETSKQLGFSSDSTLNTSTNNTSPTDPAPSDLTLPLKVRFINDEDRVFKIIWVSPDYKEFHTEYQGQLYTNLADFVNKIFEDFQKPSNDPNVPPPGNLRFDELMYELSPGKWVRLAGHLFPSELMAQQGNQQNAYQVAYQQTLNQPHLLQPPITFVNSTPTGDNCNHKLNANHANNCNNNTTSSVDGHLGEATHTNNTSYDDYNLADDDDNDEDDDYYANSDNRRRRNSFNKNRAHHHYYGKRGPQHCYKCLVFVEDAIYPIRVNSFGPTSVRDVLHVVFTESNLKHNNASEAEILRDYAVEIEDQDFGGLKIAFPRSIASFPTKCKIFVRRKEQLETMVDSSVEKQEATEANAAGDDKGEDSPDNILVEKATEKDEDDD
jgi:hypothetical protein